MRGNLALVEEVGSCSVVEAIEHLKKTKPPKFDVKKSDQMVRGAVSLPRGIGRELRVIAFAKGDKADAAKEAGAAEVGADELAKKIQDGWLDFDIVVASPDMMPVVGRLGRVLGPQGKMPSPKNGTVTPDVAKAVREFKAGKVTIRADAGGIVHAPVGKRSFPDEHLVENVDALVAFVKTLRPTSSKGNYIMNAALTTSMGPSVALEGL
jgi:large subunit ribosomal protein L1